jgi:hypothetical protein
MVRHRPIAKSLSSKAVLLVLLALQLVLGLQLQPTQAAEVAQVATSPERMLRAARADISSVPTSSSDAMPQPHCPTHSGAIQHAPMGGHDSGAIQHIPMGGHDCCHASACQCHCVYTPGAIVFPALANIETSVAISSLVNTRFVAPRIDEFLRPPIA